jgi:hypothetical protein
VTGIGKSSILKESSCGGFVAVAILPLFVSSYQTTHISFNPEIFYLNRFLKKLHK